MTELVFPWPPKELSPNARIHYHAKARIARKYKTTCWALTMGKVAVPKDCADRFQVSLTFCPPDNRRRDMDNVLASLKSGIDGMASAMGIDDQRFRYMLDWGGKGEGKPNGFVRVNIERLSDG